MIPIADQLAAALERAQVAIQQRDGMTAGLDAEIRYVLAIYRSKRDTRRAYTSQVPRRNALLAEVAREPTKHTPGWWVSGLHRDNGKEVARIWSPLTQTLADLPLSANGARNAMRITACVRACDGIPDFVLDKHVRTTILFNCNGDLLRYRQ